MKIKHLLEQPNIISIQDRVRATENTASTILKIDKDLQDLFSIDVYSQLVTATRDVEFRGFAIKNNSSFHTQEFLDLIGWIASEYKIEFSLDVLEKIVKARAATKIIDPFLEYIKSLPEDDGTDLLDTWLIHFFGAEDNEFIRLAGKRWIISAIARSFEPGCLVEGVLTLIGRQGTGKSSGVNALFKNLGNCKNAVLGFKPNGKGLSNPENLKILHRHKIILWDELVGIDMQTQEDIRNFLTEVNDSFRALYRDVPEPHDRRFVFISTSNNEEVLRDLKGNRRQWPVWISGKTNLMAIHELRDKLFAQAYSAYKRYCKDKKLPTERIDRWFFSGEWEFELYQDYLSRFSVQCEWKTIILKYLYNLKNETEVTYGEINSELAGRFEKYKVKMPKEKLIRAYLSSPETKHIIKRRRPKIKNGPREYVWVRKEEQEKKSNLQLPRIKPTTRWEDWVKQKVKTGG